MPKLQIVSNNAFRKVATEADFRRSSGTFFDDIIIVTPAMLSSRVASLRHRYIANTHQLEVYVDGLYKRVVENIDGTDYGDYEEISDFQIRFVPGVLTHTDQVIRVRITWGTFLPSNLANGITQAASDVGQAVFGSSYYPGQSPRIIGSLDNPSDQTPSLASFRTWEITQNVTYTDFIGGVADDIKYLIFKTSGATIQSNANIKLQGGVDFSGANGDILQILFDGTVWYEVSRSLNS